MKRLTIRYASASTTGVLLPDDKAAKTRQALTSGGLTIDQDGTDWTWVNLAHVEEIRCEDAPPEAK